MQQSVVIIGGGLAGLISSLELARRGVSVIVVERKAYPFHRVCGEYVSNEVRPYVTSLGLDLEKLDAKNITRFQFTSPSGRTMNAPLDLGGFGVSRYALDYELYQLAQRAGVQFMLNETVEHVDFQDDNFVVATQSGIELAAQVVLGSYGKRTKLDKTFDRDFTHRSSPYVGVKYHIRTDFPKDLIALHNFKNGYCGISAIEGDRYCLCYLTTRDNVRQHGGIPEMERAVLQKNPHLNRLFNESDFLYERPEVINEFSFAPKKAIEQNVLMVGDAAGLITPLCGNGMAMAIHGGKIAAELSVLFLANQLTRKELEEKYTRSWHAQFAARLWVGRRVQQLFGSEWLSEVALSFFKYTPFALPTLMKQTHGSVI
jgi:menaquinone-9 beta-reductase